MKKALIGSAVLALLTSTTIAASAGTTDGQGAQKSGLFGVTPQSTHACDSAKTAKTVGLLSGFAILNGAGQTGAIKKIVGEVSLKQGAPGTTYTVYLAQAGTNSGDDGMCQLTGFLTTNGQGNGNSHIDTNKAAIPVPGTGGQYYVVLRDAADEIYASDPVTVS